MLEPYPFTTNSLWRRPCASEGILQGFQAKIWSRSFLIPSILIFYFKNELLKYFRSKIVASFRAINWLTEANVAAVWIGVAHSTKKFAAPASHLLRLCPKPQGVK